MALRAGAEPFDVEVAMEHPGITAALRTCASFEARHPDPDARIAAYDALEYFFKIDVDPRDVRDLRALSRNVRAKMREVLALAAGVCVRSWQEREVLQVVFDLSLEPVFIEPSIHPLPPVEPSARRDAIVVWAPHLRAEDCALYAAALDDARLSVFIVGARGDRVPGNAQFVPLEQAGDVLGRAAVIVDASTIDPGWSIALAALGRPLAVSMSSGAQAYLDNVAIFRPWMRGDVALAVAQAMGAGPPRPRSATSPAGGHVLVATAANAPAVLADAVARRARGESFDLILDTGHPYADAAAAIAGDLFKTEAEAAARARTYDAFAANERNERGDAISTYTTIPAPVLETLRQCAFLAGRVIYHSEAEMIRTCSLLGTFNRPYAVAEPRAAVVPAPQPRASDGRIVVWAPGIPAHRLGLVRLALESFAGTVTVVDAASGATAMREALVRAAVVIAPSHDDPGPALALAEWGIPLCAPLTSGAGEYLRGCALYSPVDRLAILTAIATAFESGAPSRRETPSFTVSTAQDPGSAGMAPSPEVLVVVRVPDGSAGVERTLASVAGQRNSNLRVIEVSGTGGRIPRAVNAALRASTAEYVAVLDAGDEIFPDHVATLVSALERSGRDVAYAETLIAQPDGYSLVTHRPIEVASMSVTNGMVAASLRSLVRRTELLEAGGWNEHLSNAGDHELFLRLRKRADFVYVQCVTSRASFAGDIAAPAEGVVLGEHRLLHLLHPVSGRPALLAQRQRALDYLRTHRDFTTGRRTSAAGRPWSS